MNTVSNILLTIFGCDEDIMDIHANNSRENIFSRLAVQKKIRKCILIPGYGKIFFNDFFSHLHYDGKYTF